MRVLPIATKLDLFENNDLNESSAREAPEIKVQHSFMRLSSSQSSSKRYEPEVHDVTFARDVIDDIESQKSSDRRSRSLENRKNIVN